MFQIKFVPYRQNSAVYYLPIQAEDKFQAEAIAYELADTLDAQSVQNDRNGFRVYSHFPAALEDGKLAVDYSQEDYIFFVVEV